MPGVAGETDIKEPKPDIDHGMSNIEGNPDIGQSLREGEVLAKSRCVWPLELRTFALYATTSTLSLETIVPL